MTCDVELINELKTKGNDLFSKKDYHGAIEYYSQAISKYDVNDTQDVENKILLSVLYCNRSACYIFLFDFQSSKENALHCLKLDPSNFKAKYRLAVSSYELDEYHSLSLQLFDELNNDVVAVKQLGASLQQMLMNSKTINLQQEGKYDLMSIPFDPKIQDSQHVQNFVGNIAIKYCQKDDNGRGIFLTKDIKAGTLILVEKACSYVLERDLTSCTSNMSDLNKSLKLNSNIQRLVKQDSTGVLRTKLSYLYTTKPINGKLELPSIQLYQPKYLLNSSSYIESCVADNGSDIDLPIEDIIKCNSFDTEIVSNPDNKVRESIVKTIAFLSSEYGTLRKDDQTPQPTTMLQDLALNYSSISQELGMKVTSISVLNDNEDDRTDLAAATEKSNKKYRFPRRTKDDDNNCSRNYNNNNNISKSNNLTDSINITRTSSVFQSSLESINSTDNVTPESAFNDLCERIVNDAINNKEINTIDNLGCTALHYAVMTQNLKFVQLLLSLQDIDVNLQDAVGYTALHYASGQYYNRKILMCLCQHTHTVINAFTYQYLTPLYFAATSYNIKAMFILLKAGANPTLGHPYPLFSASPYAYAIENDFKQHIQMYDVAGYPQIKVSKPVKGVGLWLLTSFFNHASSDTCASASNTNGSSHCISMNRSSNSNCVNNSDGNSSSNTNTSSITQQQANTIRVMVGQFIFVYADRDLQADSELLISYSNSHEALSSNWGIQE